LAVDDTMAALEPAEIAASTDPLTRAEQLLGVQEALRTVV
jgi:hypothetical protein